MNTIVREFDADMRHAILSAASVCLTTHTDPDGDGLCACLALKRILAAKDISSEIVVDDLDLRRYDFVQARDNVKVDDPSLQYDLVIIIDLHDKIRLGDRIHLVDKARQVLVIDHHEIDHDMINCDHCWVDSRAVCTGWMVYAMFKDDIGLLPREDQQYIGKCLYTTILNDTNNFTNANTDAHTFELAAAICSYGVKPAEIQKLFMVSRSGSEMRLLGQVLSTLELRENGNVLFMDSSLELLKQNGLSGDATANFTRFVQDLKGVETVAFLRELSPDYYKVSLRSKVINVHNIAVRYGGGGHLQASGCNMTGSLSDLKELLLREFRQADRFERP